jgi:hypothetical protein
VNEKVNSTVEVALFFRVCSMKKQFLRAQYLVQSQELEFELSECKHVLYEQWPPSEPQGFVPACQAPKALLSSGRAASSNSGVTCTESPPQPGSSLQKSKKKKKSRRKTHSIQNLRTPTIPSLPEILKRQVWGGDRSLTSSSFPPPVLRGRASPIKATLPGQVER